MATCAYLAMCGLEAEWGYFLLSGLESARGPLGLPIERDLYFEAGSIQRDPEIKSKVSDCLPFFHFYSAAGRVIHSAAWRCSNGSGCFTLGQSRTIR